VRGDTQQSGICERMHGSLRRELLDHLVPLNKRLLLRMLTLYVRDYYNPARTPINASSGMR
jgi:transposase InsO family protein